MWSSRRCESGKPPFYRNPGEGVNTNLEDLSDFGGVIQLEGGALRCS
jgi:hypothetical protein